jgi:ParB/RepB/Spo0J family partition protein
MATKTKIPGGESREARAARLRSTPTDAELNGFRKSFFGTPEDLERGVEDLGLLDRKNGAKTEVKHQGTKSTKNSKLTAADKRDIDLLAKAAADEYKVAPSELRSLRKSGSEPEQETPTLKIPVGQIRPFEFQSRETFDEGYIAELGEAIRKVGQLQEAVVRKVPAGGRGASYELVIGECRWRACKAAGVHTLRCRVVDVGDEEAIEMNGFENVKRRSLNPIEEAKWLKLMIDKCGYTQDALARKFKGEAAASGKGSNGKGKKAGPVSQGAVSNKLRLLELPAALQAAVAGGKLSESHAVVLIPHVRQPGFAEAFIKVAEKNKWDIPSLDQFEEEIIGDAYYEGFEFPGRYVTNDVDEMKLAKAHAAELGLFEVHDDHFCFPKKFAPVWKKLLTVARAAAEKRQGSKRDAEANREKRVAPKLSAAEQKARRGQLDRQHRQRVNRWYLRWVQARVLDRLSDANEKKIPDATITRLVLFFTLGMPHRSNADEGHLTDPLRELQIKAPTQSRASTGGNVFARLSAVPDAKLAAVGLRLLRKWLAGDLENGRENHVKEPDLRAIGREMSVDVGKEWTLDEGFLQLFTKGQLVELVDEWKLRSAHGGFRGSGQDGKRSDLITEILDVAKNRRLPTPAILLETAKGK